MVEDIGDFERRKSKIEMLEHSSKVLEKKPGIRSR
jgi:hypothetical protein